MGNTSAGRVQSVALRLICDRERDIRAFVPEEYWTIDVRLSPPARTARARRTFSAVVVARLEFADAPLASAQKLAIQSAGEAQAIVAAVQGATATVARVERREVTRQPPLPYTTSTLQQDSSTRLRFSPKKTMSIAQALYEGVDLGEQGTQGLITYMRTDSTRISEEAAGSLRDLITARFGKKYLGGAPRARKKSDGPAGERATARVQDAHEAIRPTDVALAPDVVKPFLTTDQLRVYTLIWQRFVASGMHAATFASTAVEIVTTPATGEETASRASYVLRATGSRLEFDGFYAVWPRDEDRDALLPELPEAQPLEVLAIDPQQHFTQPPPRYSEASLIKELEELGIGRPSTYVPILSTIQQRKYVTLEGRRFIPEWLGETVNELMTHHFPEIVDF